METDSYVRVNSRGEEFKSYYVVWKPICENFLLTSPLCLNRTMQYGNFYFLENLIEEMFGLNRTMQYGNSLLHMQKHSLYFV